MAQPVPQHANARRALTLRGTEREYGISRAVLSAAIRTGDLPAARIGERRLTILARDVEEWLARHPVKTATGQRVDAILGRERRGSR